MTHDRIAVIAAAHGTAAVQLAAQGSEIGMRNTRVAAAGPTCEGPGAALGVIAYQCASCGIKREDGHTTYSFNAEPVITQVTATSALRAGDVIEAIADKPIITADGAYAFSRTAELLAY